MPHSALESLFMQAPALICILRGSDLVFELVNPLYQRLFPTRSLLGKPIREGLPELEGQGIFELLDRVFVTGEPYVGNEVPARLDRTGSGTLEEGNFTFIYQPLFVDGRIDGVMVFGFEVTEHVLARRQANVLAEELRAANRDKDEFIAVVAHELRTPMTSILGWVRLLRMGGLDAETYDAALEALERSTKAQAKLIEDLLDESRISSGKLRLEMRPVSLGAIVDGAVEMMRPAAHARRIELQTHISDEAMETVGDPNRLQQVIGNVLANAVKFSPEKSHVEVRLSRVGSSAEIEVRDHGRGIPPDLLPHVFDRFRQGSAERQGGLGLGLAIARHLIELQGGTISAASSGEGQGAVFRIRMPLRVDSGASSFIDREHADRPTALPSLHGTHVLIVEDDIDNRAVIAAVMARCGATVEITATALDALQRMEQRRPDVVIADIVLPDIDGCAFIERVRTSGHSAINDTPALALTVFGRPDEQARILSAGFDVLRQKPIEPADLANEVFRLITSLRTV